MMKKLIILNHNLGRLANQLWQYASVYAYALENGYEVENLAFFEYRKYFPNLPPSRFSSLLEPLNAFFCRLSPKYGRYAGYALLAPYTKILQSLVSKKSQYINEWTFRYPKGLTAHREEIKKLFAPDTVIMESVKGEISILRKKFKRIIGVHIRRGDYQSSNWKRLLFTDREVDHMLSQYLEFAGGKTNEICFLICSDGKTDPDAYGNKNLVISKGSPVEDLCKLSLTDAIIGSDSTFGAFASFYGNIPYIVFKDAIDWSYYKDKKGYFENRYNTTVNYRGKE